MAIPNLPEYWLRGPLPGIPPLLQPVAHALLQASDEIAALLHHFPDHLLWEKPAGVASPGFHLQHISGVIDRLFTYAAGKSLSEDQLNYLKAEGHPQPDKDRVAAYVRLLQERISRAIEQLKNVDESQLRAHRDVGRAKLPSTVQGLLFHAAEHTMRHTGQLLVTVRFLLAESGNV